MKCYMIGYDLNRPGQNYEELEDAIKSLGTWWHNLDSTWIVMTGMSAAEIRDNLSSHIDRNDKLLVAQLAGEAAWQGFKTSGSQWLKQKLESVIVS